MGMEGVSTPYRKREVTKNIHTMNAHSCGLDPIQWERKKGKNVL